MTLPYRPEAAGRLSVYYDPKALRQLGEDALEGSQLALILEQFPTVPDDNPREVF